MEEILIFAILYSAKIMERELYEQKLDTLFSNCSTRDTLYDVLLYLEWESSDINHIITYLHSQIEYQTFRHHLFGKLLIEQLEKYGSVQQDFAAFAHKLYVLWCNLPQFLQDEEPFCNMAYIDDPLSWGDEKLSKEIYQNIVHSITK